MSTKMYRAISAIAILGLAGATLAGCSNESSESTGSEGTAENVTILVAATSDASEEAYAELIAAFEAENPGISVETSFTPVDAYQTNVPRSMGSANGPDVVATFPGLGAGVTAYSLQEAGLIVDQSGTDWAAELPESQKALLGSDGFIAFRPVGYDTIGLIVNQDVFDANGLTPPTTWTELLGLCSAFNKQGIAPISQGFASNFVTQFVTYALVASTVYVEDPGFGAKQLKGEANFTTSDGWKVAYEKMVELEANDCFNADFEGTTYDGMLQLLATGEAAMTITVAPSLGPIRAANPEGNFIMVPLPTFDDPNKNGVPQALSVGLSVNAKSANLEAAQKFVDFANRPENISILGLGYNVIPPTGVGAPVGLDAMLEAFGNGRLGTFPNQLWASPSTVETLMAGTQALFTGQQTIDGLLKALNENFEVIK